MAEQPTKLPQWATNVDTTVEPAPGEKAAGYAVATRPAARKLNWLLNNIYTWMQYLQTPVGTGAGAGIDATGGATNGTGLKGTGGATNGKGVEGFGEGTGTGVKGVGDSAANAIGVEGEGGGSEPGVKGTGGGSNGAGVVGLGDGIGDGVSGTGGSSNGIGVKGTGGASNGIGVQGTGDGTGAGVSGLSFEDGYGVMAFGKAASPVRTSLYVHPQNSDASSPEKGGLYPHSTGGRFRAYDGNGWTGLVHNVANNGVSASINTTTTETVFSTGSYTIPANSLKVGDSIRLKAGGNASVVSGTYDLRVRLGGLSGPVIFSRANIAAADDGFFVIDLHHRVNSIGGAGVQYASGVMSYAYLGATPLVVPYVTTAGVTVDTTTSLDLVVTVQFSISAGGNSAQLFNFTVDIAG